MAASFSQIEGWLKSRPEDATHMLVLTDTYEWSDSPLYIPSAEWGTDPSEAVENYRSRMGSAYTPQECYSFTGKYSIEDQMKERRARHYD